MTRVRHWFFEGGDLALSYGEGGDASFMDAIWYSGRVLHRMDGPAYMSVRNAGCEDYLMLSQLEHPRSVDNWFRENDGEFRWHVHGVFVCKQVGRWSVNFPGVDLEFIYSKVKSTPEHTLKWTKVARCLGLMDSGLRKLEKAVRLLGNC